MKPFPFFLSRNAYIYYNIISKDQGENTEILCTNWGSKILCDFIILLSITKHETNYNAIVSDFENYSEVVENISNYTNDYFDGKNNNEEMKKNRKNYEYFIKNWEFSDKFTNDFLSEVTNIFSYNDLYPKLSEANLKLSEMLNLPMNMIYLIEKFLQVKSLNLHGNIPGEVKYHKIDKDLFYDLSYTNKAKNTVIELSKVFDLENCDEITFMVIYSILEKFKYPTQELSASAQRRFNLGY